MRRRGSNGPAGGPSDKHTERKRQSPDWLPHLAAALTIVWLLQLLVAPLFLRTTEIPYSDFKAKLAGGQITDVTLGTPIEGVMKNHETKTAETATARFATQPPPGGDPDLLEELGAAHVTYRAAAARSPRRRFRTAHRTRS